MKAHRPAEHRGGVGLGDASGVPSDIGDTPEVSGVPSDIGDRPTADADADWAISDIGVPVAGDVGAGESTLAGAAFTAAAVEARGDGGGDTDSRRACLLAGLGVADADAVRCRVPRAGAGANVSFLVNSSAAQVPRSGRGAERAAGVQGGATAR